MTVVATDEGARLRIDGAQRATSGKSSGDQKLYSDTTCNYVQIRSGGVMRPMTRDEVRTAIANLDPMQKKVHLPTWFDDVQWSRIEYLGWRDLRTPMRAYVVADVDDQALGVVLRQNPNQAVLGSRSVMCELCRFTRRFNEVSLFTAQRPSLDKRQRLSVRGLHVCTDLDCNVMVGIKPLVGPLDPPAEETIERRRQQLRERTTAFLRSVADVERTAQRSS